MSGTFNIYLIASNTLSINVTLKSLSSGGCLRSLILSRSCSFSFGQRTCFIPAVFAPSILDSNPPIFVTLPFKSISPVIAKSCLIENPVNKERIASVIAVPAEASV